MKIGKLLALSLIAIFCMSVIIFAAESRLAKVPSSDNPEEPYMASEVVKTVSGSIIRIWDDGSWDWVQVGLLDFFNFIKLSEGRRGIETIPPFISRQAFVMVSEQFCLDRQADYPYGPYCKTSTDCCCAKDTADIANCESRGYPVDGTISPPTGDITVADCVQKFKSQGYILYTCGTLYGKCDTSGNYQKVTESNDICGWQVWTYCNNVCPTVTIPEIYEIGEKPCADPIANDGLFTCYNNLIRQCDDGVWDSYKYCTDYGTGAYCVEEKKISSAITGLCTLPQPEVDDYVCCFPSVYSTGLIEWTTFTECLNKDGIPSFSVEKIDCKLDISECGNGECEPGESITSCPADCKSTATANVEIDKIEVNVPSDAESGDYITVNLILTNTGGAVDEITNPAYVEIALYGGDAAKKLGLKAKPNYVSRAYGIYKEIPPCQESEYQAGYIKSFLILLSEAGMEGATLGSSDSPFKVQIKIPELGDTIASGESNYDENGEYVLLVNTYDSCWTDTSQPTWGDSDSKSVKIIPTTTTEQVCCVNIFSSFISFFTEAQGEWKDKCAWDEAESDAKYCLAEELITVEDKITLKDEEIVTKVPEIIGCNSDEDCKELGEGLHCTNLGCLTLDQIREELAEETDLSFATEGVSITGLAIAESDGESPPTLKGVCCVQPSGSTEFASNFLVKLVEFGSTFEQIKNFFIPKEWRSDDLQELQEEVEEKGFPVVDINEDIYFLRPKELTCKEGERSIDIAWCDALDLTPENPTNLQPDMVSVSAVGNQSTNLEDPFSPTVACIMEDRAFYSEGRIAYATGVPILPIFTEIKAGRMTVEDAENIDTIIPGFANKYRLDPDTACCGDLKAKYVETKKETNIEGVGGILFLDAKHFTYDIYECKGEFNIWEELEDAGIKPKYVIYGAIILLLLWILPRLFPRRRI